MAEYDCRDGTTEFGGHNCGVGSGTVFHLRPPLSVCKTVLCAWTETDLYDFPGGTQGAVPYGSVVIDASGNLYGTASQGGTHGYGVIWEITP